MKKSILILLFLTCKLTIAQNYDSFIGDFYIKKNKTFIKTFKIIKENKKYYFKSFKNEIEDLIEIKKIEKIELNSSFYKPLPNTTSILGDNKNILIFKVPKGWKSENFISDTEYFIITMVGPINVYKK